MSNQRDRLNVLVANKLKKIRLGDQVTGETSGPQLVMVPDEKGQSALQYGWVIFVTLKHNKLIGQEPIGVMVPLAGVLPPDRLVEQAVEWLLEQCREARQQMNTTGTFDPKTNGIPEALKGPVKL